MRICKCGGIVSQAELTSGKERWFCAFCKKYEIIDKKDLTSTQNAYNRAMDNRKAHDGCDQPRGAL